MRVGWGFDAHRFSQAGEVLLAGVVVARDRGVEATSDGDVVAHAVADAMLGAAAMGDLGQLFPSNDPAWEGADSMNLLSDVASRVTALGLSISSIDVTVIAQAIRVSPHRDAIRRGLAGAMGIDLDRVSCKATTTDGLGFIGREEGIAAVAVATVAWPAG
ncbi:MAG TPA: 2-C-methyl-D-erythritol 2,4-cyclodiphosphate synthase [Acidimicrobiia bacterium]|nr:2-C-methyl-D-erythritol 2,4-cyclodiphosphate synthase [Acidimicrobiia bacterium]